MANFALQLCAAIAVMIADFEPFKSTVWVGICNTNGVVSEVDVNRAAEYLSQITVTLAWEAVCRAIPNATNARIEMSIKSVTHNATYNKVIIEPDTIYAEWSPNLSETMKSVKKQVRDDIVAMLTDINAAHFSRGFVEKEVPPYELRMRD